MLQFDPASMGAFLAEKLGAYEPHMVQYEYGTVISCGDDIVRIQGFPGLSMGNCLPLKTTCTALRWTWGWMG